MCHHYNKNERISLLTAQRVKGIERLALCTFPIEVRCMVYTSLQSRIQRIPIVGRRKIKNESEKKVDRSAKTPNGQSIQDIVDAYFAIHCTIIPSNRGPTTLKKHDKRFFVPFNPRLEVWLIGTLLVGVTRKSDVWASRKIQKTCVFCPNHTGLQSDLDFRPFLDMPLVLGIHLDPKLLETEVGMILDLRPPEIQAPVTLSESQGTKIFGPKISSHHPGMMLLYAFWRFVLLKML